MAAKWSAKDPNDIADYWFDWGSDALAEKDRFLPAGETITAATVMVPAGITKVSEAFTNKTVRVRVSGGTVDTGYPITCLITTSDTQVFEMTNTLQVKERAK